jgi:hypothetical protein
VAGQVFSNALQVTQQHWYQILHVKDLLHIDDPKVTSHRDLKYVRTVGHYLQSTSAFNKHVILELPQDSDIDFIISHSYSLTWCPNRKKWTGVKSGDLCGHSMGPGSPIHLFSESYRAGLCKSLWYASFGPPSVCNSNSHENMWPTSTEALCEATYSTYKQIIPIDPLVLRHNTMSTAAYNKRKLGALRLFLY